MVARSAGPEYDRSAFVRACSVAGAVLITKDARKDAKEIFSLLTDKITLEFIATDGLESCEYDNTNPLEKGPPQDLGTPVDGYTFSIGSRYCYIAFYLNRKGVWIIKSFHPPTVGERATALTYNPFASLEELKK